MIQTIRRHALIVASLLGIACQAQEIQKAPLTPPPPMTSILPDHPLWSVKGSGGFPPFLMGDDALFICQKDTIKRLNFADGSEVWSVPSDGTPIQSDSGLLFLANSNFELSCLDALTGQLIWKVQIVKEGEGSFGHGNLVVIQDGIKGPVVTGNKVLVGTFGGSLFKGRTGSLNAFSRKDGKLLWSFEAEDGLEHPPLIHKGKAIFGGVAACYSVDLETGKQIWKASTRSDNQWFIKIVDDTLLMSSGHYGAQKSMFGGTLYAFDLETGVLRWKYDIGGPSILRVAEGKILGIEWGAMGGTRLTCLNLATGQRAWEFKEKSSSWPLIHDGKAVYLSKDNRIHLVDIATGKAASALPATGDFQMGFFKGPWSRFLDPQLLQGHAVVGSWDKSKKETVLQVINSKEAKCIQEKRIQGELWDLWERKDLLVTLVKTDDGSGILQVLGR
jgi:outer membrane protein assembly factor BamB